MPAEDRRVELFEATATESSARAAKVLPTNPSEDVQRCSNPTQVFDAMSRAVGYCQKRLGGETQDDHGGEANLAELRRHVADIERQLKDAGIQPGNGPAMRLF